MVQRKNWLEKINNAWKRKSVVWLAGVRRVGKTCLAQSIPDAEYFDCELPRTRVFMDDPQEFLNAVKGKKVILDEIHRLANPSELLKISADYYPDTKVLATGSSTLGASAKFRDTLTGRKAELWLTPLVYSDLKDFGRTDVKRRLHQGGLPPFFLAESAPEKEFQEWMDAFWAKDIQELFRLERRHSFQRFLELLFAQSGAIFEATRFAVPCEISRVTVSNYLNALEATLTAHVIRPYSTHKPTEIVSAPKVYAFDTGFVCHYRGWNALRKEDMGVLWEHFVLNELHGQMQTRNINYWRDKRGHEIDFVFARPGKFPSAIECKWSADGFVPDNLHAFRRTYPKGENYVVAHDVERSYAKTFGEILKVKFVSPVSLSQDIENHSR